MASKCVIEVKQILDKYAKNTPVVGKLLNSYFNTNIGRLFSQGAVKAELTYTTGVDIALRETQSRFLRQEELPEAFTRPGDVPIVAQKGKIHKREAQQAGVMNQYGLAPAYADIAGLQRAVKAKGSTGASGIDGVNLFVRQLDLHDATIRGAGLPLVTAKPGIQDGAFHYSFLTFGDVMKVFLNQSKPQQIAKFFLRSSDGTKNVQNQNLAEAVRRILEHGDTYGRISFPEDYDLLKAQVVDALRNPSGLGKPVGGEALTKYNEAIKWANTGEGLKLTDELADELLNENLITALVKGNEEMRLMTMVMAKGDGFKIAEGILKMITELPNVNDRIFAYGDLLFNDRFRKIFTDDALVKMTPEELNLAFGENFLAQFFNEISEESLAAVRSMYRSASAKQTDLKAQKAEKAKTGKKSNKQVNVNRAKKAETEEISANSAAKAADDMSDGNVVVQEPSLEGAQLARQYQLEFEVGPLLGGVVRAFGWVNDKLTMGGKMKTALIGTEHFRLENAATMTAQLSKLFRTAGENTALVNDAFRALQNGTPLNEMPETQRAVAEKMSEFIDQIFGFGSRNKLDMNGIFADEFTASLKDLGLGELADVLKATDGYADDALGEWWKTIDIGDDQNALTVMAKVYSAMQLSRIKPTIASTLRHHFSHTAEGLTYDQAVKLGYKKLADTSPLSKFINVGEKPPLFHPQTINQMSVLNAHLEYERGFPGKWQKFFNVMDPTIGVLKSSLTIWRPGHHMVSAIGNVLFNTSYGVNAADYATAMRMMRLRGDVLDADETALTQALREGGENLYELAGEGKTWPIVINGKVENVPLAVLVRGAEEIAGVPISPRRTKDLPNDMDPSNFGVEGWVQRTPGAKQIAAADHGLAKVAAIRDNVARFALFARELRRGGYNSIEDAILAAGQKVHEVHPTVGTLTAGERKFARRAFYFYTWQKQALFKILELAANKPSIVTIPSKIQYAMATGAGLNPESFGDGWDPNGLYASYFTNSVFAPQQIDPTLGAIGVRPASPQLDVIDAFFSKVRTRPNLGFWEAMGELSANAAGGIIVGNATPLFKIPAELATGTTVSGQRIDNISEYLLDQTGLGIISRMSGFTPWGEQRSDFKEGEYGQKDRERQILNYITGIKSTYYQSPASLEIARRELIDYWQRVYKYGKYAEEK